ncbi:undecaprenyl/decaprenyl-phosphate alpha-N-acetylglucosaminyl 1-phosphate transferase [Cupriavidus sp. WGtm5]|uniref:MraY family glycosyltransferase n=1 Tax=Cupriavidus sp. WGtm5 TaxID=2919926 RepID=UPI00209065A8|nr:MraY family glycosyltransferase [Cupriavidus sp. WGtm5]MCO4888762.1 undecaprenyl/decaprenyl-phosphate alpha-N-acetylglucosaminyl 1-phosphate transferase [Cupriavidus sp. WGtm5]
MFDFFWVPLTTALISAVAILMLRPLAKRGGLLDRPGGRKRHAGEVPLVGGIAILIAIGVGANMFVRGQGYYVALFSALTLLALTGLIDDLRGLTPLTKLAVQLFAGILMTSWGGVFLHSLGDIFARRVVDLGNWGIPLTLFAVVAVVNAVNMSDGLDGLAGGLALSIFGWYAYLAGETGNLMAQRICMLLVGALVGFLIFNMRNPLRGNLRVFLGDAGSLMLGLAIVWFAVELSQPAYNTGRTVPPVVMLWVVGFLLIDLLAVVARRLISGRNPMSADRTHLHHILSRMDVSAGVVVWTILASNAVLGLIGVSAWKLGVPEHVLFLLFLIVTAAHLIVMRNAAYFLRSGRRLLSRRNKRPQN